MLKDTGERLVINDKWEQKTITEHLHRYHMIASAIKQDSIVLDAACGTGYGSQILARHAKKVLGIDLSADAIDYAQKHYSEDNLSFLQMSVAELEFPDSYFDVVVSFETIEHVDRATQKKFLREIKRCLKPDGILAISTPDDALLRRMTRGEYSNEYHVAEFAREEFKEFLKDEFEYVTVYYQNISEVSSILKEGSASGHFDCVSTDPENTVGRYYLAICSNTALPTYPNDSVYIPSIPGYYEENYFQQSAILYVDCGEGFTGDLSVVERSTIKDGKKFHYHFITEEFENIRALRFDPCETSCKVKIEKVESNIGDIAFVPMNGNGRIENFDVFYDVDPMYLAAEADFNGVRYITIEGTVEPIPVQTAFAQIHRELDQKQAELDDTQYVLSATRQVLTDTAMFRDQQITEVNRLEEEASLAGQAICNLQEKVSALQSNLDLTQASLSRATAAFAEKTEEAEGLRVALSKTQNEVHDLEGKCCDLENALSAANAQVVEHAAAFERKRTEAENLRNELSLSQQQHLQAETQCRDLEQRLQASVDSYNAVLNSRRWRLISKILRPYELLLPMLRRIKNNRFVSLIIKALRYWKQYGTRALLKKVKIFFLNKRRMTEAKRIIPTQKALRFSEVAQLPALDKKIAVQLHLYYEDLAEEFINYLNYIPYRFDLFISCRSGADCAAIERKFRKIRNVGSVKVKVTENRGRDISPVYVLFREELMKYDYFAHIHSKKSLYSGKERRGWRQYALDCLMGSPETVERIFSLFESDNGIGLFSPETFDDVPMIANTWLSNEYIGKAFLNSLGIPFNKVYFNYPVGSFFWAKTDALLPVFERKLTYADFPEEAGQTDGTLAHALERAIATIAQHRGYHLAFYDLDNDIVQIGQSYKYLQPYFSLTTDAVQYHLGQYDIVTFDIFDTLLTRRILHPDDIFGLIGIKIEKELGIKLDFLPVRKAAEAAVWEKHHAKCSIHEIYKEMGAILQLSDDVTNKIKAVEIETEKELLIPRKDMLKIYEHLQKDHVRIILISDMYLPKDVLEDILHNCGYYGWEELWVSCDIGARKDDGSMWNIFFEKYGKYRTVHVGDNPRSDGQFLLDRGREFFPVLSSWALYSLSALFEKLNAYDTGEIENSIALGLTINEGLFNSPFALDTNGLPTRTDAQTLGFSWVGPIFAKFARWLSELDLEDTGFLFLAREGYILQKAYAEYCNAAECDSLPNSYLLTSRRAASVAGIRTETDLREVVNQYYAGTMVNFLEARFGIKDQQIDKNKMLYMPQDEEIIMEYLRNRKCFGNQIEAERSNYLQYISELNGKMNVKHFAVVDVGYSGTIQFYLSRMLEEKVDGYYLSTGVNRKPLKLGCKCEAIYPVDTVEATATSKIFASQLFLEAVLQAPYGQLIHFEREGDRIIPRFKDDSHVPETVTTLQEGVLQFIRTYGALVKTNARSDINPELAEDLLYYVPMCGCLSEKISKEIFVQDDYCSNGNQHFDPVQKKWIVS